MYWIYRLPHPWRYIAKYVCKSVINKRWITLPVVSDIWSSFCLKSGFLSDFEGFLHSLVHSHLNRKGPQSSILERRIQKRPDQQKYTLSRNTEFCKADRTTWKLTLQDINTTQKEPKQSGVVAVDSCFAIVVAHQYGATNTEALIWKIPAPVYKP